MGDGLCDWIVQVVLRPRERQGFVLLPKRWVERTLGWLTGCRRLNKDYERLPQTADLDLSCYAPHYGEAVGIKFDYFITFQTSSYASPQENRNMAQTATQNLRTTSIRSLMLNCKTFSSFQRRASCKRC